VVLLARMTSFHVQVSRSRRSARVFNLSERELVQQIVQPWMRGEPVEVGDREWPPSESRVTVLEGRALDPSELAHGQGWNSALRVGEDVTKRVFHPPIPAVALVAATRAAGVAVAGMLGELGVEAVGWGPDSEPAAVPVVIVLPSAGDELTAEDMFELGRAAGAAGPSAVFVELGAGPVPPAFESLDPIRLSGNRQPLDALAERLGVRRS
jgi:hypothetical protein